MITPTNLTTKLNNLETQDNKQIIKNIREYLAVFGKDLYTPIVIELPNKTIKLIWQDYSTHIGMIFSNKPFYYLFYQHNAKIKHEDIIPLSELPDENLYHNIFDFITKH